MRKSVRKTAESENLLARLGVVYVYYQHRAHFSRRLHGCKLAFPDYYLKESRLGVLLRVQKVGSSVRRVQHPPFCVYGDARCCRDASVPVVSDLVFCHKNNVPFWKKL